MISANDPGRITAQQRRFDKILAVFRPILVIVLGFALVALVVVGLRIQSALVELRADARDILNWNITQIEVGLVRLIDEIRFVSVDKTAPLAELRKGYDLFYSRSQNAINGDGYSAPDFETQSQMLAELLQDFLSQEPGACRCGCPTRSTPRSSVIDRSCPGLPDADRGYGRGAPCRAACDAKGPELPGMEPTL